ncbi:response regulator [Pseudomonas sp. MAFF212428]|uniref:Response regulator n=1 Tax=Pseudomonas brassicae TaxID=2708063 RepID=A0A6B3NUJ1_9PSED|nr:response regulator [Pseudomonas brassicae]NER59921.1 response regulator [Pseudomonas brassicae]NER64068.1 response regulator [Pseudomonas brassicae]
MSRILVVDDEYLITDILGLALEDAGYEVEKAANGAKAMDELRKVRFDLVITDYMMPTMNGEEFAKQVREDDALKHLPIVLMSGAQADIGKDKPGLFNEVIAKPFDLDALVAKVRSLIDPPDTARAAPDPL